MSKIQLPIAELKPALAGLGKVISKSASLPVLRMVKVDRTKDGWITLTGTDLNADVTVRMEEPIAGEPASILAPFEDLVKTTKGCSSGEAITIEQTGKDAVVLNYPVGQQTAQIKLESMAVEEFPPVPKLKSDPVALSTDIRTALLEAMDCASTDPTRYILQGACIDVSDNKCHHIVGTDGRHLYSSNSFSLPLTESLIIPTHKFLGWKEFNADGEWQLRLEPKSKDQARHLQISSRRWRFIHRGIEGNYPNWRQVVPKPDETKSSIELEPSSADAVIQLITRMPCHDKVNRTIGIEVKGRSVKLLGKSQASEPWTSFDIEPAKTKGTDITVYLKRDFLTKALRFGLSRIEISDELSPVRFVSGGRQLIVVPIRGDAVAPASATSPEPPATNINPPPEEAQQERTPTMPKTNGSATGTTTNGAQHSATSTPEAKPALETALAQIEIVRGDFRNAIAGLNKLGDSLRQAQREQKTADKDVQSVRNTLEKLQSVRI